MRTWKQTMAAILIGMGMFCGMAYADEPAENKQPVTSPELGEHNAVASMLFGDQPEFARLRAAYDEGRWSHLIVLAEEMLNRRPNDSALFQIIGYGYFRNADYAHAEPILDKIIKQEGANPLNHVMRCLTKIELDQKDVLPVCLDAARRVPENDKFIYRVAEICEKKSQTKKALELYKQAWNIDRDNLRYLTAVTMLLYQMDRFKEAYDLTKQGLDSGMDSVILYHNIIFYARKSKMYTEALEWIERGSKKYTEVNFFISKAEVLFSMKKYEESYALWSEVSKTKLSGAYLERLQLGYGKSLLRKGDLKSYEMLNAAKNSSFAQNDKYFPWYLGAAALINGKYDVAKRYFGRMHRLKTPEDRSLGRAGLLACFVLSGTDVQRNGSDVTVEMIEKGLNDENVQNAISYYGVVLEADPNFFENIDRLFDAHAPHQLVNALRVIDTYMANRRLFNCHCEINRPVHSFPAAVMLVMFLAGLMGLIRRRAAKSDR